MNRTHLIGAVLLIAGVGLLVNPYVLWPHHGDGDAYEARAAGVDDGGSEAVQLEALPPETAEFVEGLIERADAEDDDWPVFEDRDAIPDDGVTWVSYFDVRSTTVTTDGAAYQLRVETVERSPPLLPENRLLRATMGLAGSLLAALGGLVAARGTSSLTPRRAWLVVGTWAAVLAGTIAYDGGPHGVVGDASSTATALPTAEGLVPVLGVVALLTPAIGIVIGAALRARRWRDGTGDRREAALVAGFVAVTTPVSLPGVAVGWALGRSPPAAGDRPVEPTPVE